MSIQTTTHPIRLALLAVAATLLVACQTTPSKPIPARIQVEEAIGFTIIRLKGSADWAACVDVGLRIYN